MLEVLRTGRAPADVFGTHALYRPYLPRTAPHLSPAVLNQLHHAQAGRPPVHEAPDFALYFLSSKGGMELDYYLLDNRWLIYDRHTRWAYWQEPLPTLTKGSGHIMPIEHPVVTSEFGPRWGKQHKGLDLAHQNASLTNGLPVRATMAGRAVRVVYELDGDPAGIRVAILSKNGYRYNYYHLQIGSNKHITLNQLVRQGEIIGNVGGSGFMKENNYAPHLHYEIWRDNDISSKISPDIIHIELKNLPRR